MALLQAGAHRLYVRDVGRGPPVLLLHGFPDDGTVWDSQVKSLVADGYRAIVPTLLGYPPSDAPTDPAAYALGPMADGLVSLLDGLGLGKVAVVGHDWGAALAWRLALAHPKRVSRLAVVSVGHPACGAAAGGMEQRKRWWYMFLMADPQAERLLTADNGALLKELLAAAAGAEDAGAQRAYWDRMSRPGVLSSALNWYRANHHTAAIAATRQNPAAPKFRVPTLGVYPAQDGALTEAQMAASGAYAAAPGLWQFARIDRAGHWPQRDAPEELSRLLLAFLQRGRAHDGGGDSWGSGGGGGGGSGVASSSGGASLGAVAVTSRL